MICCLAALCLKKFAKGLLELLLLVCPLPPPVSYYYCYKDFLVFPDSSLFFLIICSSEFITIYCYG